MVKQSSGDKSNENRQINAENNVTMLS